MKTSVPNVTYVSMFEFLMQELELRMEVNHLMAIIEYVSDLRSQSD
jgi:hypothetical protein